MRIRLMAILVIAAFASLLVSGVAGASPASAKTAKKVKCKKGYILQTGIRDGKKRTFCVKHTVARNGTSGTGKAGVNGVTELPAPRVPLALRVRRARPALRVSVGPMARNGVNGAAGAQGIPGRAGCAGSAGRRW